MRILVTGGFGFIGGHLIERLLQDPAVQVHVVDDLSSAPIPLEMLLKELGEPPNLTYDIFTVETYCRLYAKQSLHFDQIYHLASPVGPAGVLKHGGTMIRSIVRDIYLLMELAMREGARLLDVSTSEVYGGGQQGLCSEAFPKIISPITTIRLEYAVAKLAAETALINTCKMQPLDAVIIRPFNVAGPRQSGAGGFVLPRFISQAILGNPITVFGTGTQVRAFTHVKDIVEGLVKAMQHGQRGEAYNLGNISNRIAILRLAEQVKKITHSSSEIMFVDPTTIYGDLYAEASDKYPDETKALFELKWQPSRGIESTIRDAFHYIQAGMSVVL